MWSLEYFTQQQNERVLNTLLVFLPFLLFFMSLENLFTLDLMQIGDADTTTSEGKPL